MTECPAHPGVEAVGTCARCGRFYCAAEARAFEGQLYCGACAERPEVNWLAHHYAKLEGQRSGLAWFSAFLGVVGLLAGGGLLVVLVDMFWNMRGTTESLGDLQWVCGPVGLLAWSLTALLVWTGRPWALWLNLVGALVLTGFMALANTGDARLVVGGVALLTSGFFWGVLRRDVRTRLFFRLPVERGELLQHYTRYGSNWQAAGAARLAVLGLFIPVLPPISLGLAVWGLARVDRHAVPPVGGAGGAIGAAVLSVLSGVAWGALVFR